MKRNLTLILLAFSYLMPVVGMPYKEARDQALYLTDKMAYELNLNNQQYNDCYEINLDYFLSVQTPDEVYGPYLAYRNADLRHILLDWQFRIFSAVDYFLHPLEWLRGAWHYPVYRHYAVNHFYYSHPQAFWDYHGGHGRAHFTHGFYADRRPRWDGGLRGNGGYRHPSSTRITASRPSHGSHHEGHGPGSLRDNHNSGFIRDNHSSGSFGGHSGSGSHIGDQASNHGSNHGSSNHGFTPNSNHGSNHGSIHGSNHGSAAGRGSSPSITNSRGGSFERSTPRVSGGAGRSSSGGSVRGGAGRGR